MWTAMRMFLVVLSVGILRNFVFRLPSIGGSQKPRPAAAAAAATTPNRVEPSPKGRVRRD